MMTSTELIVKISSQLWLKLYSLSTHVPIDFVKNFSELINQKDSQDKIKLFFPNKYQKIALFFR